MSSRNVDPPESFGRVNVSALGELGVVLPLPPAGEPRLVVGGGDAQRSRSEERAQRRLLRVHDREDGGGGGGGVTRGADALLARLGDLRVQLGVRRELLRALGGRPAPVRRE